MLIHTSDQHSYTYIKNISSPPQFTVRHHPVQYTTEDVGIAVVMCIITKYTIIQNIYTIYKKITTLKFLGKQNIFHTTTKNNTIYIILSYMYTT